MNDFFAYKLFTYNMLEAHIRDKHRIEDYNVPSKITYKLALKELVDTFLILADQKDVDDQTLLFTEYVTVQSYSNALLIHLIQA